MVQIEGDGVTQNNHEDSGLPPAVVVDENGIVLNLKGGRKTFTMIEETKWVSKNKILVRKVKCFSPWVNFELKKCKLFSPKTGGGVCEN